MTLIVASDLHLGAGANLGERLADQQSSWTRVCTAAAELGADVLFAGDAFHARRPLPAEMRAWQAGLDVLRDAGRTLVAIPGNHDVSSLALPTGLEAACAGYDAHVLRSWRVEDLVVETIDGPVGFLPWTPSTMPAPQMAESLLVIAQGLADAGARMLISHWALSGASLPTGLPVLELAEPILDSFALAQMGFDVVLSGHIHKRQVIVEDGQALVAHIGPLSRTSFSEASVETGAWQIDTTGGVQAYGDHVHARWFEVPDRAFVTIEADVRETGFAEDAIIGEISAHDVDGAVVRVQWNQRNDQTIDVSQVIVALEAGGVWSIQQLTPIVERVQSTRSVGLTEQDDPTVAFDHWLGAQADLAAPETMATVRERAHERIGGAS
jgi:DNA repair exonuclease SbcCD nuclease subunit